MGHLARTASGCCPLAVSRRGRPGPVVPRPWRRCDSGRGAATGSPAPLPAGDRGLGTRTGVPATASRHADHVRRRSAAGAGRPNGCSGMVRRPAGVQRTGPRLGRGLRQKASGQSLVEGPVISAAGAAELRRAYDQGHRLGSAAARRRHQGPVAIRSGAAGDASPASGRRGARRSSSHCTPSGRYSATWWPGEPTPKSLRSW